MSSLRRVVADALDDRMSVSGNGGATPFPASQLLEQRSYSKQDGGCHDSDAYRKPDDRRNELNESGSWFHNLYTNKAPLMPAY